MHPILDVLKDFFNHFLSLVEGRLHLRSLAGRVFFFYGKLGNRVS